MVWLKKTVLVAAVSLSGIAQAQNTTSSDLSTDSRTFAFTNSSSTLSSTSSSLSSTSETVSLTSTSTGSESETSTSTSAAPASTSGSVTPSVSVTPAQSSTGGAGTSSSAPGASSSAPGASSSAPGASSSAPDASSSAPGVSSSAPGASSSAPGASSSAPGASSSAPGASSQAPPASSTAPGGGSSPGGGAASTPASSGGSTPSSVQSASASASASSAPGGSISVLSTTPQAFNNFLNIQPGEAIVATLIINGQQVNFVIVSQGCRGVPAGQSPFADGTGPESGSAYTPGSCASTCSTKGLPLSGSQRGICNCGSTLRTDLPLIDPSQCRASNNAKRQTGTFDPVPIAQAIPASQVNLQQASVTLSQSSLPVVAVNTLPPGSSVPASTLPSTSGASTGSSAATSSGSSARSSAASTSAGASTDASTGASAGSSAGASTSGSSAGATPASSAGSSSPAISSPPAASNTDFVLAIVGGRAPSSAVSSSSSSSASSSRASSSSSSSASSSSAASSSSSSSRASSASSSSASSASASSASSGSASSASSSSAAAASSSSTASSSPIITIPTTSLSITSPPVSVPSTSTFNFANTTSLLPQRRAIIKRKIEEVAKRQTTAVTYVGRVGNLNPTNCQQASVFRLGASGTLTIDGAAFGVNPGVLFAPLRTGQTGSIIATFTAAAGSGFAWSNPAFFGGQAGFCQDATGQVYATFANPAVAGNVPNGCTTVSFNVVPNSQCSPSGTTLPASSTSTTPVVPPSGSTTAVVPTTGVSTSGTGVPPTGSPSGSGTGVGTSGTGTVVGPSGTGTGTGTNPSGTDVGPSGTTVVGPSGTDTGTTATTSGAVVTVSPNPGTIGDYASLGCFSSGGGFPSFLLVKADAALTIDSCIAYCNGSKLIGVFGEDCYCGSFIDNTQTTQVSENQCNTQCPGNPLQRCGGQLSTNKRQNVPLNVLLSIYVRIDAGSISTVTSVSVSAGIDTTASFTFTTVVTNPGVTDTVTGGPSQTPNVVGTLTLPPGLYTEGQPTPTGEFCRITTGSWYIGSTTLLPFPLPTA